MSANVRSNVQKIVKPIVRTSWRSSLDNASGLHKSYESAVTSNLPAILSNEKLIRTSLRASIDELVDPYMVELEHKVCMPILGSCFKHVVEAYEQALIGFNREMRLILDHLIKSPTITTMNAEFINFEALLEQRLGRVNIY